jgi:hypothetical protein
MAGEQLHLYDLGLCDYATGNVAQYLLGATRRRGENQEHRRSLRHDAERDFATWLSGRLPAMLEEYIWPVPDGGVRLPLSGRELQILSDVMEDVPARFDCVWVPYPAVHAQAVYCVPEIKAELTRHDGEAWSAASAEFARRLARDDLPVAGGIAVVSEWLVYLRRLLKAIGAIGYLPYPLGQHPTPTVPCPPAQRGQLRGRLARLTDAKLLVAIAKLRAAIAEKGSRAPTKAILAGVKGNRQRLLDALRFLQAHGEYHGHRGDRAERYVEGRPNER